MNKLGIDTKSKDASKIYNRLKRLKSTVSIDRPAKYCLDQNYSQILIDTTMSEDELDDWLYNSNFDYVGVFVNDIS